jgi:hypothetical protein
MRLILKVFVMVLAFQFSIGLSLKTKEIKSANDWFTSNVCKKSIKIIYSLLLNNNNIYILILPIQICKMSALRKVILNV